MADEIFKDFLKYTVMYPYDFFFFFPVNKSKIYKRSPCYIRYKNARGQTQLRSRTFLFFLVRFSRKT